MGRSATLDERLRRLDKNRDRRVERNMHLPARPRARVDELAAGSRERLRDAERADLVNAALTRGLPAGPSAAAARVADYTRQLELAGAE